MEYEKYLNTLSLDEVKKIVTFYNKFVKIPVSKSTKEQLIQHLVKHTDFDRTTRNISIKEEFLLSRKSADETKVTQKLFKDLDPKAREELRTKLIANTTDEARKATINKIVDKLIENDKKRKTAKAEIMKGIEDRATKRAGRKALVSKLDESMALTKGMKDRGIKKAGRKALVSKLDESMALTKGIKDRETKKAGRKALVSRLDESIALTKDIKERAVKRAGRKALVSKLDKQRAKSVMM
jgi:hypothetical protein